MNETMPPAAAAALAEAKQILQQLGGCALLIGVEAYDGLPVEKQLLAGRNDVLAYWKVCRRLGYRPEHIRVLTSPVLTPGDIVRAEQDLGPELHPELGAEEIRALVERWFAGPDPVVLGDASRDSIRKGVEWLASKLVFYVRLDWEGFRLEQELAGLPGLLAYSGHGAHHQGDLVLCPSDVGQGLERALPFAQLRALIDAGDDIKAPGTPHPADNLTVVLDCCFAAAGEERKALRVPTLTPGESEPVPAPEHEIGTRVFCASGRDERAYQGLFGGRWHGAFTWAITRALEQWKTAPSGQFRQFRKSTISHVELLFRARMLLEAMSFDQRPMLVDRLGNLPVFQHSTDVERETSADPDAKRLVGQIDPADGFAYYTFSTPDGVPLAEVVATSTADNTHGSGMKGGREYWRIHGDRFRSSDHGDLVVTKVQGGHWSKVPAPSLTIANADFSCPVAKLWADHNGAATYHKESQGVTHGGFVVDVARQGDGRWTGTMEFYRDTRGGLLFATMTNGQSRQLTKGTYTPSQKCLITELEVLPKVISGQSYILQDLGKYVGIHKSHWSNNTCYATTDQGESDQPQRLRLVGTSSSEPRAICSGDTIYIQSIERDISDWYLRPSGSANDLYYEGGTNPGTAHQWTIKKFPYDERDNGKAILLGDLVTFQSQEGTNLDRYMGANAGDGYLSVPQLARPWAIKPA